MGTIESQALITIEGLEKAGSRNRLSLCSAVAWATIARCAESVLELSRFPPCHSDPAAAGEESLIISSIARQGKNQRCFASLNVTDAFAWAVAYKMIVSPRAGPTLTMDNFAPVNSEMYLTYFLAAEGSCENFRAE